MYERFYGFSGEPFNSGPDLRFLYLTPSHAEAYRGMLSGIKERKSLTVITGDPGVGKTVLIRALLAQLDQKVRTALIVFTLLEFSDLLKSICRDLGILTGGQDTSVLLEMFYRYLFETPQDETVAIIIDEAQGLDVSVLNDLVSLWATDNPYLQLQAVLIGQPGLETKLDAQELKSLRDMIAFRYHVRPLTRQESSAYIDHRLRIVGSSSLEVFKPEAVDRICDCAAGNPRTINTVCEGALLVGYGMYRRKIDTRIVNEAIEDLRLSQPREAKRPLPEPLPAEEPRPEELASEPVPARRLWERPIYQLLHQLLEWVRSLKPVSLPEPILTAEPVPEPLTAEPVPEPLTAEPVPEPLPAEEPRPEELASEPVPARRLWGRPVYQLAAGSALVMAGLILLVVSTLQHVPPKETSESGVRTVIAEKGSALSMPAEQNKRPAPVPSISVKRQVPRRQVVHEQRKPPRTLAYERKQPPQPSLHNQEQPSQAHVHDQEKPYQPVAPYRPHPADQDALSLKQDAAWAVLGR